MPKSKRERVISLSKTKKKDFTRKEVLVETVRAAIDEHDRMFLLRIPLSKADDLAYLRNMDKGKLMACKNSVFRIAFGKDEDEEYALNLHRVGKHLEGQVYALFTSESDESLREFFAYSRMMHGKKDSVATRDVVLKRDDFSGLSHSQAPHLRSLGVKCKLDNATIVVEQEMVLAKKGKKITAEQAQLLKLLGIKMIPFVIQPFLQWEKRLGKITEMKN